MLTTGQLEEFKWTAEQYVKAAQQANLSPEWIKKLETLQPASMSAALKQSNCKFNSKWNFCLEIRWMGLMIF